MRLECQHLNQACVVQISGFANTIHSPLATSLITGVFAGSCLISEGEAGLKDDGNGTMILTKEVAPTVRNDTIACASALADCLDR